MMIEEREEIIILLGDPYYEYGQGYSFQDEFLKNLLDKIKVMFLRIQGLGADRK